MGNTEEKKTILSKYNSLDSMLREELIAKLQFLESYISSLGSLAVGFSGGVDSTFLLVVAHSVLLLNR